MTAAPDTADRMRASYTRTNNISFEVCILGTLPSDHQLDDFLKLLLCKQKILVSSTMPTWHRFMNFYARVT